MEFNKMEDRIPLLTFEFANSTGEIQPFTFSNPVKVITAQSIEDVLPSLEFVQNAVEKGYYAAGFLSYESAAAFDPAYKVKSGYSTPLLWFGIFSEPQHVVPTSTSSYKLSKWEPDVNHDEYHASITSIKKAIENGITYQTNYTIRLTSQFQGGALTLYEKMKKAQASNYCAYIDTGEHCILSASPELFFHLEGDKIITRPMKGTIKRGLAFEDDRANADWLYHSEKNRAENVMIVDLLRNDLGIIAEPGTVSVSKLFEIEHYPTVHQMTSTITAKIKPDTQLIDIFKALFPCGSITGAPKISTMNMIAELEKSPREVYCGAIGFITPNREAIFNVPIRTVMIDKQLGTATYGVGGGITWDSTTDDEYNEILTKSSFLEKESKEFQLLESVLLNNGEYFLLQEHLNRLEKTANYFQFQINLEDVNKTFKEFADQNHHGQLKVRFLLNKIGKMTIEGQPILQQVIPKKVTLANVPIDQNNLFLYHKTTNRDIYLHFQNKDSNLFDVLLWNEKGELTEFTNGNVVLEVNGNLWTPPIRSGLLAGTFRDHLIHQGKIREKVLEKADLERSTRIWFINSVRKWVEVEMV